MRQWRLRLEINREARQLGVGVGGGGGASSTKRPNAPRGEKLADPHGLLQRVQHGAMDGGAHGGGHLRACNHTGVLMPITWGWNVTRSRVNEGLKREKGVINRGATVPRQRGYRQLVARQSRPRHENS